MVRVAILLALLALGNANAQDAHLWVDHDENGLQIIHGDTTLLEYHQRAEHTPRPFIANLRTLNDTLLTRHFPSADDADHADMHPGLWLSFGDINGHDFWRNKTVTRHSGWPKPVVVTATSVTFESQHEYLEPDGAIICREHLQVRLELVTGGYLIHWDSTFTSEAATTFGDQEEMGLGFRLKPEFTVDSGNGTITNNHGNKNGGEVWGKLAEWCDYSATTPDGTKVGITLIPHPENFAPSWMHARDYGLLVANPFGQNAMTGGEKQETKVEPDEALRLRFGLYIHDGERALTPAKAQELYLENAP